MKLISNGKKDYFDYLIHQYGVDPLVILDRRSITKLYVYDGGSYYPAIKIGEKYALTSGVVIKEEYRKDNYSWRDQYVNRFLVVNGMVYPLVETIDGEYTLANETNSHVPKRWLGISGESSLEPYFSKEMVEASKLLGRHCFIIDSYCNVEGNVPNLADVGLAKIVPAQEMYLQTVQFISEHLSDKLEEAKPQTNKEKIVSHGFDLKTSFRNK